MMRTDQILGVPDEKEIDSQIETLRRASKRIADETHTTVTYVSKESKEEIEVKEKETSDEKYTNIDPNEYDVQALRYLKGMFIMIGYMDLPEDETKRTALQKEMKQKIFEKYTSNKNPSQTVPPFFDDTRLTKLEKDFANYWLSALQQIYPGEIFHIGDAHIQITMARDAGISRTPSVAVKTIDIEEKITTTETTTPLKISPGYYDEHIAKNEGFIQSAQEYAGFRRGSTRSWLRKFYSDDNNNIAVLKEYGVPATPSSRYLPLPGNARHYNISVKHKTEGTTSLDIIAIGTLTAFDLDTDLQDVQAVAQLKEIYNNKTTNEAIKQYEELYGDYAKNMKFGFHYQTLLSPVAFAGASEEHAYPLGHTDNNARFVSMSDKAMAELKKEVEVKDKNIEFSYTNAAINKNADKPQYKMIEASSHRDRRFQKLKTTANLIGYLIVDHKKSQQTSFRYLPQLKDYLENKPGSNPPDINECVNDINRLNIKEKLKREVILRARASYYLKLAMNKSSPYDKLENYQRNIMISALETLSQGKQALTVAGCKSARDRTAVYLSAVKTMMQDPEAMHTWDTLNSGIIDSLKKGHHYMAMRYHCGILKVKEVHQSLLKNLSNELQDPDFEKTTKQMMKSSKVRSESVGLGKLIVGGIGFLIASPVILGIFIPTKILSWLARDMLGLKDFIAPVKLLPVIFTQLPVILSQAINDVFNMIDKNGNPRSWANYLLSLPPKPNEPNWKYYTALSFAFVAIPFNLLIKTPLKFLTELPFKIAEITFSKMGMKKTAEAAGMISSFFRYTFSFDPVQAAKECASPGARPSRWFGPEWGKWIGGITGAVLSLGGIVAAAFAGPAALGALASAVGGSTASASLAGALSFAATHTGVGSGAGITTLNALLPSAMSTAGIGLTTAVVAYGALTNTLSSSFDVGTENLEKSGRAPEATVSDPALNLSSDTDSGSYTPLRSRKPSLAFPTPESTSSSPQTTGSPDASKDKEAHIIPDNKERDATLVKAQEKRLQTSVSDTEKDDTPKLES